ncbi:FAD-binding protein [Euzebya sp.]|uniref:FAD-binding protein n=1 Tax=Euzebya sp. TaxID=1971409 RepID=UPI003512CAE2
MSAVTTSITTAEELRDVIADARHAGTPLDVRGGGSVLDRLPTGGEQVLSVAGMTGVVSHAADDLTITVRAGTPLAELAAVLAEVGQECPIEPAGPAGAASAGTVGGRIATGLAGPRQLGAGRVRDWVLRVAFVTGAGHVAAAGGVTVKDVSGYDICRLLTGSWGTLAVITEVTLKVRPLARHRGWYVSDGPRHALDRHLYRPSACTTTPTRTHVLLEGHPDDAADQAAAVGLEAGDPPDLPGTARAAVDPAALPSLAAELGELGLRWAAQDGVGVCHLDGDAEQLAAARAAGEHRGGRLVVLVPSLGLPAFGGPRRNVIADRIGAALDPDGVLAPHRWTR